MLPTMQSTNVEPRPSNMWCCPLMMFCVRVSYVPSTEQSKLSTVETRGPKEKPNSYGGDQYEGPESVPRAQIEEPTSDIVYDVRRKYVNSD